MTATRDSYLVIGGCGFVGRHIVEQLLARGEPAVTVFDLVQRHHDKGVQFFSGDICDEAVLGDVISKTRTTCIIHTASPMHGAKPDLFWKVNVEGTKAVLAVAQAHDHVTKLVYTSSAGVTFTGEEDIVDIDERLPYVNESNAHDTYNLTKAKAEELVLDANGKGGVRTVAIRPAGIFGPGDRQNFEGLADVIRRGQTKWQIGSNENLFDWTYVGNVAKAHLLAADKLGEEILSGPKPAEDLLSTTLSPITLSSLENPVPCSVSRPLGPALTPVPDAEAILASFRARRAENGTILPDDRPVTYTKYDQFTKANLEKELVSPLQVSGQAFYVTNGEPVAFWDYVLAVWKEMGHEPTSRWVIPVGLGMYLATAAEFWAWVTGRTPGFTRERVGYSSRHRWFNIEKARRVLGYEPEVGLVDGIKISAQWYLKEKGVTSITAQ